MRTGYKNKKKKKKPQHQKTQNQTKQKELYIILGNESILCGFDFLTRQSGICRQIIPHRLGQPLSSCYRVASPPQKQRSKHKTHHSSANPFSFLCESSPNDISHAHDKVSPSFPCKGILRSGKRGDGRGAMHYILISAVPWL